MPMETLWAVSGGLIVTALRLTSLMAAGLALGLVTLVTYRLYVHPLSRVPGPTYAAASNVWQGLHARSGRLVHLGRTLHRQYGSVVRVGPNEVWFDSEAAFRTIYSAGNGYAKSDFYLATALTRPRLDWALRPHFPDTLDFLSEFDAKRYRLQRRLVGPVYQTSSLAKHEATVDSVLERTVAALSALEGAEVDLKEWMHMIAVECLGAVVLSWSPGMLSKGTDEGSGARSYQGWRRKTVFGLFPLMAKLGMCSKRLGRALSELWGVSSGGTDKFRSFFPDVNKRVSRRVNAALRPSPPKDKRKDLLADLIQLHRAKPSFTETYLRRMAITNFGAGHETMAATLTSVVAMIASHPDVQTQVADELARAPNSTEYATAVKLSYVQAAIKEAKRLHPVIGTSLPRTVPAGGLRLHGHFFPAGTTVGCNPVALHSNRDICYGTSDPRSYDPGRWLGDGGEAARRMERCSLAWGGGARTCPGRHLAELVVFKVVPAVFAAFDVRVVMPPDEEMPSYFLSMMTGVKARFIPRTAEYRTATK